jgi:hypothetical protein
MHQQDDDMIYNDLLNEAILQSLLDQERQQQEANDLADEDKILAEVMKMSALEYQKNNGQIDLSHIKRKKKEEHTEESLTDA